MDTRMVILAVVGASAVSAAIGGFAGYRLTEQKLRDEYDALLQSELELSRQYYTRLSKKAEYQDPAKVVARSNYQDIIVTEGYVPEKEDLPEDSPPVPEELRPLIITMEDFIDNPDDYEQHSIMYYEADDVLVDEHDIPIDDLDGTIGLGSLDAFGFGSRSPDIMYIRNRVLESDFEVLRDRGSYEESVMGSMKHSDSRGRPRKFRLDED